MYNSYDLDMDQIEFIEDIIQGIYSLELIFQDFKLHELNINWDDTKFIIPYFNSLNEKLELLNSISGKIGSRLHSLIIFEAIKTLKDNSQNINKLIQYAIKVIAKKEYVK